HRRARTERLWTVRRTTPRNARMARLPDPRTAAGAPAPCQHPPWPPRARRTHSTAYRTTEAQRYRMNLETYQTLAMRTKPHPDPDCDYLELAQIGMVGEL